MRIKVMGSAAGGGFPQWNCNCPNCDGLRRGTIQAKGRTQSSIAVSSDGVDWLLINASPDVLQQIKQTPEMQPARGMRDTGIAAVMIIDAQIDHVTGLMMLRERGAPMTLYATPQVLGDVSEGFPITRILSHYCGVDARPLQLDGKAIRIDCLPGASLRAMSLSSKPPPYSPHRDKPRAGDNIGLMLLNEQNGKKVFYAPGLGAIEPQVEAAMLEADIVLVDGTFWTEDEMTRAGLSKKLAAEMGHLPQSGAGGMIEWLDKLPSSTRKILIHINNTNPILREDSAEREELTRHGIEVAFDGMEVQF